jgi:hypothetical protein
LIRPLYTEGEGFLPESRERLGSGKNKEQGRGREGKREAIGAEDQRPRERGSSVVDSEMGTEGEPAQAAS